ncbi:MAG: tRNA 2-selenouridine synthase, partial [Paraburkholderia sp.]|nr:tRNA 2-selenouridine synthase [Paraburkholderia sp.]
LEAFRAGRCVRIVAPLATRVRFLLEDYGHLFEQPQHFKDQLTRLVGLQSHETVDHWHALIDAGERAQLFAELVERHYDPAYARSSQRSFGRIEQAMTFSFDPCGADRVDQARTLLALIREREVADFTAAGGQRAGAGQCMTADAIECHTVASGREPCSLEARAAQH